MSLYSLITPKAFSELLQQSSGGRVVPVDATYYNDGAEARGKREFMEKERIANAVYFDIDVFSNNNSPYPHMLPGLETFNEGMRSLGLQPEDILVVYDRAGNFNASRIAWQLGTLGHGKVFLLTGLNAYKDEGYPLETTPVDSVTPYSPSDYTSPVSHAKSQAITYEELLPMVESGEIKNYNLFDMRSLERFLGEAPDIRPEVAAGHIPGAQPMPYIELLENGTFPHEVEALRSKLSASEAKHETTVDPLKETIVMCGSGITACIARTTLDACGYSPIRVYDGSWAEWGQRADPKYILKGKDW